MRVFISAGEPSGDMHAAAVARAISAMREDARLAGVAGPALKAAGCEPVADMGELNVMGLTDVLRALPRIRRVRARVLEHVRDERPDVAVLVDFPGFHMDVGTRLRRMGVPVLQYIAPKLWAWGAWRARRLKRAQDALACILPFEPAWFAARGVAARYVGNPSAAACAGGWSRAELARQTGLDGSGPLLALLPGSRASEIARHASLLAECLRRIREQRPDVQAVVPRAPGADASMLAPLAEAGARFVDRMSEGFALRADAAIAVSGTATLELALWDVPSVLIYRASPLTVRAGRLLVRTPYIGLANILLEEAAMPELIQEEASVERIVAETLPLLAGEEAARSQRQRFVRLRDLLGEADPANAVAEWAIRIAARSVSSGGGRMP